MGASHIAYVKLGENRGMGRYYSQGQWLQRMNFFPGRRFRRDFVKSSREMHLVLDDQGDRIVSRKTAHSRDVPVVDINDKALTDFFKDVTRLRVVAEEGRIILSVHHEDLASTERLERLKSKVANGEPLKVGSVCHGGGVLDLAIHKGLENQGLKSEVAFSIEIEPKYLDASLKNNPVWSENSMTIEAAMELVETDLLPHVEIFVGGLPCTGASLANRGKSNLKFAEQHESAGKLFFSALSIIKAINAPIVVLENVPEYQNTVSMYVIRDVLDQWGYELHETILDGSELGALERRLRYCLVAVTKGIDFTFDMLSKAIFRNKEERLGDILEEIDDSSGRWGTAQYLKEKEVRDKAAGKGFRMQLLDEDAESCGTIGRGYHKHRSTEPRVLNKNNPNLSRLLTPKEHARVKTADPCLIEGISDTTAHEILGQSVVQCAFETVARLLGMFLTGKLTLPSNVVSITTTEEAEELPVESSGQLSLGFC